MKETKFGPHQGEQIYTAGQPLDQANAAMLLVHGRGATAASILELANELYHPEYTYLAPQAAGNKWYPYSFLAPLTQNEPWLSSGIQALRDLVAKVEETGIPSERIVLTGFSQGACLASEFVARHTRRYGGLLLFSGGLIGPPNTPRDYEGSLAGTPAFLSCSDIDPHIPLELVEETAIALNDLGAAVNQQIYPGMGHTIVKDQIEQANKIVKGVLPE